MSEAVEGPYQGGYYIAAYACPLDHPAGEFVGYFKLFLEEPESPWHGDCILKGRAEGHWLDADSALANALDAGKLTALNMPPASSFTELRTAGLSQWSVI